MSGYAQKLFYKEDVGSVGMPKSFDPNKLLQQKIEKLAWMIKKSKHLVAFTGAGISTSSCGIPDFRGPKGVSTLQHEGKGVPQASLPFDRAMPSITHMALVELERAGILKFVISQDKLPQKEMELAEEHCKRADVVLCLGTSLQITPACILPLRPGRGGGEIVIVNLQQTPEDKKAKLVIHGLVDKVISGVMKILNMRIPPYVQIDLFQINYRCNLGEQSAEWEIEVRSVHGKSAPLPFIKSIEVSFREIQDLETILVLRKQPFTLKRDLKTNPVKAVLRLNFSDGCACRSETVDLQVDLQASTDYVFPERNVIFQNLRDTAECCGQFSVVERMVLPVLLEWKA